MEYCDRCAKDQIKVLLSFIDYEKKVDSLLELIETRYSVSKKEEILGGSRLNKIFMEMKQ
jgi:hypothetical protein